MCAEKDDKRQCMIGIYARQSVERMGSISIDTQISICKSYATEEVKCYVDAGFSGKNMQRPQLMKLMEDISAGSISAVFVYKLDRISRSLYDFSGLMDFFTKKKIRFVSCTEWFDTSTPMGRAMLSMAATFAQLERETISQRVADVYAKKSRLGVYMGGQVPFGFELTGGRLYPKEREKEVIEYLFRTYADGTTYAALSDKLNQRGVKTRQRKAFSPARIGEILRNPVYLRAEKGVISYAANVGIELIYEYETGKNHGFFQYGKRKELWVSAPHEGIVTEEVFLAAQYHRKRRSYTIR